MSSRSSEIRHFLIDEIYKNPGNPAIAAATRFGVSRQAINRHLRDLVSDGIIDGDENLVSRSQAKRLLTRIERFREVLLDFEGVTMIGQAFADEIFRVFQNNHPDVRFSRVNANENVEQMIKRALIGSVPEK